MKKSVNLTTYVKQLLADDNFDQALQTIMSYAQNNDNRLYNSMILQSGRLKRNMKQIADGLTTGESARIEMNRIRQALTYYADELPTAFSIEVEVTTTTTTTSSSPATKDELLAYAKRVDATLAEIERMFFSLNVTVEDRKAFRDTTKEWRNDLRDEDDDEFFVVDETQRKEWQNETVEWLTTWATGKVTKNLTRAKKFVESALTKLEAARNAENVVQKQDAIEVSLLALGYLAKKAGFNQVKEATAFLDRHIYMDEDLRDAKNFISSLLKGKQERDTFADLLARASNEHAMLEYVVEDLNDGLNNVIAGIYPIINAAKRHIRIANEKGNL